VERGDALARAAAILDSSRQPLFAGLGADVDGVRAILGLADRVGGVVDHMGSEGLFRNLRVLQDVGWVTTTLSEVRNRADVLLVVGPDPAPVFPRFYERCVEVSQTLFSEGPLGRRLFRLGPPSAGSLASKDNVAIQDLHCPLDRLPDAVAVLAALVKGARVPVESVAGIPVAELATVVDCLKAARYGIVIWAASLLDIEAADLIVQSLVELVRDLNVTTRCAALPLTGSDNLLGANQACTWQAGFPLRTGFARGFPEHDQYRFSARRMIEERDADALVWISAFRDALPPPAGEIPTVLLAPPYTRPSHPPTVFIPVGTPGIDHAGQVYRSDGVVSVRLSALRARGLPSVADVMSDLDARLSRRRSAA
jgi:formylmethanofuran dehydrogenase subunit B